MNIKIINKANHSKMNVEQLTQKLQWARKQKSFAWAKYYEQVNGALHNDHGNVVVYERIIEDAGIPPHIKEEMKQMAVALKKKWECPICMEMIDDGQLEITNCGHYYCKACLDMYQQQQKRENPNKWKCAVCRRSASYKDEEDIPLAQLRR
jgi:hypothetical protein